MSLEGSLPQAFLHTSEEVIAWRWVQVEIDTLKPGMVQKREPAKPQRQTYYARRYGQQAYGAGSRLIGSLQVSEQTAVPLLFDIKRAVRSHWGGRNSNMSPPCTAKQVGLNICSIFGHFSLAFSAVSGLLCLRSKQ